MQFPRSSQRVAFLAAAVLLAGVGAASLWAAPNDKGEPGGGPKEPRSVTVGSITPAGEADVAWVVHDSRPASFAVYVDGRLVITVAETRVTLQDLPCGRSVTIGVEAVDKQGRHSPRVTVVVSASPCASLWVATDGSDLNACTRDEPCRTFNAAYMRAEPGRHVFVEGGTYPEQVIVFDPTKTASADVVIEPAPGARVLLSGALQLGTWSGDGPRHLTVKGLEAVPYDGVHFTSWQAGEGTQDVTWVGLRASNFYIRGVKDFHIVGGTWGPCYVPTEVPDACNNNKIDYSPEPFANENITIDGATFRNLQCRGHDCRPNDVHFECLFLAGGRNIAVRNSTFRDCEFYDIFVTRISDTPDGSFDGLVIENNFFDTPWDGQGHQDRPGSIAFKPNGAAAPAFSNVLVRFNSFGSGISINDDNDGIAYADFRVVGNIGAYADCYPTVTYAYNVWGEGTCASTDRSLAGAQLPYANAAAFDFHLTGGVAADLVPGSTADQRLARDIDGDARPAGRAYDAGADERR